MPTNPRPIRILTVDDHALLRVGIAALVSGEADMRILRPSPLPRTGFGAR